MRSFVEGVSSNAAFFSSTRIKPLQGTTPKLPISSHGINQFKRELPSGVAAVVVMDDFGDTSAMLITIESNEKTFKELKTYMSNLLEAQSLYQQSKNQYIDAFAEYQVKKVAYLQSTGETAIK